ncbi:MAG: ATP-dependent zinc metalloprotease FtsH [Candidatus Faecenecus gallistercoris]|nr:ATP-dependent zinc metalloprotease FtsH [Bacillota bacterium]MDY4051415.1 ATP-dependent zinc metalloprotease FtsH [Candidatus Faecenecus gallistercoris]
MNKNTVKRGLLPYVILLVLIFGIYYVYAVMNQRVNVLTYQEFSDALTNAQVTEMTITPRSSAGVYEMEGSLADYDDNETFFARVPMSDEIIKQVLAASEQYDFELVTEQDPESSPWLLILVNVVPLVILIGGALWIFSRQMGSNNKSMDFGRSKARLSTDQNKVTFNDVAGLKEEKEEVRELIDFLKNPKRFQKLGARIPKGVLLVGPPGTGKTLLAKAVAGEANVPFYFISGSDFVELFVGVGASRVRDMFKQAKANAPCLIFIDEIDAVGRQRGTGLGGGHDEREQTLNQLLTEMDGFGANEGIIVIAATNRADVLDPALLRPGRFDRQVTVGLPDVREREDILTVHAKNKVLAPSVQLNAIAKRTPGFSGADLENLLNEAALLAVRRNKNSITMAEIDEATDRVIGGPAKTSRKYTPHEKELVAYHEAGHAVLGIKLENADDVQKITIIPRGQAGGYTMMMPKEEHYFATKTELLDQITGLLGGRVSEELRFHESTTGAHNDFERATKIARAMVTEYGMSDLGPIQLEQQEGGVFLGRDYNKTKDFSNEVAHEIDLEMRKIVNSCYERAKQILSENQDMIKLIVDALLERETITKEQIDYLVEHGTMPPEDDEEKVVDNKEEKDVEETEVTESSTEKVEESPKKESKNKKQHNKSKQNKGE